MKRLIQPTKNHTLLFTTVVVVAVAGMLCWVKANTCKNDLLPIQLSAIKLQQGWGYEIWVDQQLFIRQDYIPAVNGRQSFVSRQQALLVGNKAIEKLKAGTMPQVTVAELRQWGIQCKDECAP